MCTLGEAAHSEGEAVKARGSLSSPGVSNMRWYRAYLGNVCQVVMHCGLHSSTGGRIFKCTGGRLNHPHACTHH